MSVEEDAVAASVELACSIVISTLTVLVPINPDTGETLVDDPAIDVSAIDVYPVPFQYWRLPDVGPVTVGLPAPVPTAAVAESE